MRYLVRMDSTGEKAAKLKKAVDAARDLEVRLMDAALASVDDDHHRATLYEFARAANQVVLTLSLGQGLIGRQNPLLGLGSMEARKLA